MRINKNIIVIIIFVIFIKCETNDKFYRPNVPQILCTLGIIDIDDTTIYDVVYNYFGFKDTLIYSRYISVEKSFQFEFADEVEDSSLHEINISISDESNNIFQFQGDNMTKKLELILPQTIKFESFKKYFLNVNVKGTSNISADIEVPGPPPPLSLLSTKTEIITIDRPYPNTCFSQDWLDVLETEIEFSFLNDPNLYYAILLVGSRTTGLTNDPWSQFFLQSGSGLLDFNVIETNTQGFFYNLQGRQKCNCFGYSMPHGNATTFKFNPVNAYFIDGSSVPSDICSFKISVQNYNGIAEPGFCKSFRIRLMSIPKELYLFEKSLYKYSRVSKDPFSEPVTPQGNIKNGNGIFAICRSRELIVYPDTTIIPFYNKGE